MTWSLRRHAAAALVLACLSGAACRDEGGGHKSPKASSPGPRQSAPAGEVVVSYPEEPASFNPYLPEGDSIATSDLLRPVLPTLLSVRPDLKYGSALAVKVPSGRDIARNPFSVTFHLDPRAVWSDGKPITASDVRFTWETIKDPKWPIADRTGYDRLTDVVVINPSTVRLVFDGPYGAWKNLFSAGDFILPGHYLRGRDFAGEFAGSVPISGGPFVMESRTPGLEVVYRANPMFKSSYRVSPGLQRVRVLIVPDSEIGLRLLGSGRTAVLAATTRVNLRRRIEAVGRVTVASRYGASWWQLFYNHARPATSGVAGREAVARSFDRPGFSEAFIRSDGRLLDDLVPSGASDGAFSGYRKDVRAAGSLAGSLKDRKLVLAGPGGNQIAGTLGVSIQKQLQQAGMQLEIRSPESQEFYRNMRRDGNFDIGIWELRGAPNTSFAASFHSSSVAPTGTNYSRIKSAQIDAAVAAADAEPAPGPARRALSALMARELVTLPLLETKAYLGYASSVTGPQPNATVDGPFWNLEAWRAAPG